MSGWLNWATIGGDNKFIPKVGANRGNADAILTVDDAPVVVYDTTLTAARDVLLPTEGLYNGLAFRLLRTAGGAFALTISDGEGAVATIGSGETGYVDVVYNGTDWRVLGAGPLTTA